MNVCLDSLRSVIRALKPKHTRPAPSTLNINFNNQIKFVYICVSLFQFKLNLLMRITTVCWLSRVLRRWKHNIAEKTMVWGSLKKKDFELSNIAGLSIQAPGSFLQLCFAIYWLIFFSPNILISPFFPSPIAMTFPNIVTNQSSVFYLLPNMWTN